MLIFYIGTINNIKVAQILENISPKKTEIFSSFLQKFAPNEPYYDMLQNEKICKDCNVVRWKNRWKRRVVHEKSGPCYTYNPPRSSNAGSKFNIKIIFKGKYLLIINSINSINY